MCVCVCVCARARAGPVLFEQAMNNSQLFHVKDSIQRVWCFMTRSPSSVTDYFQKLQGLFTRWRSARWCEMAGKKGFQIPGICRLQILYSICNSCCALGTNQRHATEVGINVSEEYAASILRTKMSQSGQLACPIRIPISHSTKLWASHMEKKTAVKENSQLLQSVVLKKKPFNSSSSANHKTHFSATVVSVKPFAYSLVKIN